MIRILILLAALLLAACAPHRQLKKEIVRMESSLQEHAGFSLYDPASGKFLVEHRSDRYFTPASNTKIFTFYTSLKLLGDSIPFIKYEYRGDSLLVQGLGDASFLYPNTYTTNRAFQFLQQAKGNLYFSSSNFQTERFGYGWAWDDYPYAYSPERSSLPIYGNLIQIERDSASNLFVYPPLFSDSLTTYSGNGSDHPPLRRHSSNTILLNAKDQKPARWGVPFHYTDSLFATLLSDTLHRSVKLFSGSLSASATVLRSIPSDSLLRVMMQESDNFIAEQLLLQCAWTLSDTLQPDIAIRYALKNLLNDLPDVPQWVDGSGLSRYNLFTPRSLVKLWEKIAIEVPRDRLFKLVAMGGGPGTLQNHYKGQNPYVFGKTGTLSNNHCLSGFLITRKGRMLIFSFMHNNFVQPGRKVREEMEEIVNLVHEKY